MERDFLGEESLLRLLKLIKTELSKYVKLEKAVTLNDNGSVATHDSSEAIGDHSFAGGLSNIAYSRDAFVGGFGNIAGGKGFKIIGQGVGETEGEGYYDLTSVDGIEVGQNYIVRLSSVSANISGEIVNVTNNRVYVNGYEPKLLIEGEGGNNPEVNQDISQAATDTNYLCIVGHPELGDISVGFNAVVFGEGNIATERSAASFGRDNQSLGQYAFTEGRLNIANYTSHAECFGNSAVGISCHAEGRRNTVSGDGGHVEGVSNTVTGYAAHGEGQSTKAIGPGTHTEGYGTIAIGDNQHVQGMYNIEDAKYAHIIGNGSSNSNRSNAHTVDWEGNAWYKGKVKVGGTSYDDASEVATQDFVIAKIKEVLANFINVSEEGA